MTALWQCGERNSLGIVQEIEIWPCEQVVYAQPRICPRKWNAQNSLGFWDTNGSPNLAQTTRPIDNQQQKKKKEKKKEKREPAE